MSNYCRLFDFTIVALAATVGEKVWETPVEQDIETIYMQPYLCMVICLNCYYVHLYIINVKYKYIMGLL